MANIKSTKSNAILVFCNSIGQLIQSVNITDQTGNYYFEPDNSENGFYFCNVVVDDEVIEVKQLVYTK